MIAYLFILMFVPAYLTFDPSQARVNLREDVPWHYGVLAAHVIFGTVAMATVPFQLWPRFRQRFPAAHRFMGRAYVFVGVIPSSLLALAIVPFAAARRVTRSGRCSGSRPASTAGGWPACVGTSSTAGS